MCRPSLDPGFKTKPNKNKKNKNKTNKQKTRKDYKRHLRYTWGKLKYGLSIR